MIISSKEYKLSINEKIDIKLIKEEKYQVMKRKMEERREKEITRGEAILSKDLNYSRRRC